MQGLFVFLSFLPIIGLLLIYLTLLSINIKLKNQSEQNDQIIKLLTEIKEKK